MKNKQNETSKYFFGKTRRDFLNTVGGADIIKEIIE